MIIESEYCKNTEEQQFLFCYNWLYFDEVLFNRKEAIISNTLLWKWEKE